MLSWAKRLAGKPVVATVISKTFAIAVPTAPSYMTTFPLLILSAAIRPWRFAGTAKKFIQGFPVNGCGYSITSPTAYTLSSEVRRNLSTTIPPRSPIFNPALTANELFGRTPIDRITISVSMTRPLLKFTFNPEAVRSKEITLSFNNKSTPFWRKCSCIIAAVE